MTPKECGPRTHPGAERVHRVHSRLNTGLEREKQALTVFSDESAILGALRTVPVTRENEERNQCKLREFNHRSLPDYGGET